MRKMMIVAAAALLGTVAFANAAEKGASSTSPGHQMQSPTANPGTGASENSPGDSMQDKGTVGSARGSTRGASEYSPGDRMNDQRKKQQNPY